ncbi:methionine aminotransferase [Herpetosiphon geysericola]|uniref:Aminotransferase n=1 Tax=Herpetosiphon geysericola TaxID=70996 RepID=A0A0P6XE14_9CHLR|nr:methionine aminotransferase [Herpetosiphon geysericola]KPL81212.1 aminotransferase [Herpetosiphon geysericola]
MHPKSANRLAGFGTSIFSEISALSAQYQAINLGQGFPDFAGPAFLKDAACSAINADLNQYAPSTGLPSLRAAIARTWERHTKASVDPETEITVTSGATEALFASIMALINPGEEVIIFEPYYDAYPPNVLMAGGIPRYVRLSEPRWDVDFAQVRAAITPQTKAIILNTPHNPTGKVWSRAELSQLAAIAIEHDLLVLSDEVYDRLVFEDHQHCSIATLPGMWERTVTISSTGKTFSVTGWKIGYAIAPNPLTEAIRRVHQFVTFASATPLQAAAVVGLNAGEPYERQLLQFYSARRTQLVKALGDAGLYVLPPQGTYFVMADIRDLGWDNDAEFCRYLISEIGVAAIPPSAFYHDNYQAGMVRFCFAKKPETIAAAAEKLKRLGSQS